MIDASTTEMPSSSVRFRLTVSSVTPSHAWNIFVDDENDGDGDGDCDDFCSKEGVNLLQRDLTE